MVTREVFEAGARHPPLADVDLRLLRVFNAIVQANGFRRPKKPFACRRLLLTEAGRQVHWAMLDLFGSLQRFNGALPVRPQADCAPWP